MKEQRYSAEAKGVIKTVNSHNSVNEVLGTINFKAYGMEPGDWWIASMTQPRNFAYQTLATDGRYSCLKQIPLVFDPREIPLPRLLPNDVEIDWTVEYTTPELGDQRGLEVINSDISFTASEYINRVKVTADIENKNSSSKSFFVIARIYNKSGVLIATPTTREKFEPNSTNRVQLNCSVSVFIGEPDIHDVVLQRTQS
ncbi:hypothetical protein [Halorussus pelagicus]|uniref:hypothetical protein n=1 Tax=Halorussus pelagicus TaxID=2505977 RepID=UPI000FFB1351|nr:hypothetical protein [Halorussus pelagicus]